MFANVCIVFEKVDNVLSPSCFVVHGSFSNNSVFLVAALVGGEAMSDLVRQLLLAAVHHVVVEVPGFK